jgi:DNA-binding NarL/FixJ family response regulator
MALTSAVQAGLAKRKEKAEAWINSVEEIFANFDEVLCFVDVSGAVMHASPLIGPLLEAQRGLRIRGGRLWHRVTKVRELITQALIQAALKAQSIKLLLPGEGGRTCLFEVARASYQAHLRASPLLMVRLRPGRRPGHGPRLDALCAAFGLTETEGHVLHALVDGKSPETVAREHGVSMNTVRKQIAAVMDKTGCTRQIDLVRMALSGG